MQALDLGGLRFFSRFFCFAKQFEQKKGVHSDFLITLYEISKSNCCMYRPDIYRLYMPNIDLSIPERSSSPHLPTGRDHQIKANIKKHYHFTM